MLAAIGCLMAVMTLEGVKGDALHVTAELDALNVRVGDPLELRVTFSGTSDFKDLHSLDLAKSVDPAHWRVDEDSVKVQKGRSERRLVYRVRPIKEGLISFPELSFAYRSVRSEEMETMSTEAIPLHVRPASQVTLADLDLGQDRFPSPDGLFVDLDASPWGSGERLSEDELFAWRKACQNPSAEAFRAFDVPEARFNEAACLVQEGEGAAALKIYRSLEWKVGQTPTLERGIVAALAAKTGDPSVELPMWRQVLRPVLRYALRGRVLVVSLALALLVALAWLVRRLARLLACCAVLLAASSATAEDVFERMDREMEQMRRLMHNQMNATIQMGGPYQISTFGNQQAEEVRITTTVAVDRNESMVGEPFNLLLSVEMPKSCTVGRLRLTSPQSMGLSVIPGGWQHLTDGVSTNDGQVVRRIAIPVWSGEAFSRELTFTLSGECTRRVRQAFGNGFVSSSVSQPFESLSAPCAITVRPLPEEGRPADFSGIVGRSLRLRQRADRTSVQTNDIVTLTCQLDYDGYLPDRAIRGWTFKDDDVVRYPRYFVATGASHTDDQTISYYDLDAKDYRRVTCPGVYLSYRPDDGQEKAKEVVVNASPETDAGARLHLRFAPQERAAEIATVEARPGALKVTETSGAWSRVDDGRHAGWIKTELLK